jgi:secondary thiamine-phosphate synthase enzyme
MEQLDVRTPSHACMVDITGRVSRVVSQSGVDQGVCYVFVPHTTAGLTINENADPTVQSDILDRLDKLVPWRDGYQHSEGNSAAHIKASLMGPSHAVLVRNGELWLGTWQGVFLCEFDGPRSRRVWVKVVAG